MEFVKMHPADQLVEMMNRIYACGMTTTSGGNLSVRDANGDIWITPSGVDKGSLTREDIMQVRPDGTYIGKHKPSVEFPFHRDIYKARPDIGGIVHAHPPMQVGFSLARRESESRILPEAHRICGDVVRAAYHAPGTKELDEDISARFAEGHTTVLMDNHGVVCGGKDLMQAFIAFETITLSGEAEINALRLGIAHRMRDEQLENAAAEAEAVLPEMKAGMPARAEEEELREKICAFARRCYGRKLLSAAGGCISVRLGDGSMLMTPADKDHMNLAPGDIVRVDSGCREAGKVPGELARLQEKIYAAHPFVNAVIITRAPSIMGFAVAHKPYDARMISEGYIILGDVARMECESGALDEEKIISAIQPRIPAVVVDNRCAIVCGASLINAFDRTEVLEYGAASVLAAGAVGRPITLTEAEIEHTKQALGLA